MTLVHPVSARLVTPDWAARVASPLHDVLSEDERRAVLAGNPDSYLHVTSEPLVPAAATGVQQGQAAALQRLLDRGAFTAVPEPSVFVYQLRGAGHEQTGVVAGVDLAGFADGRVLGHERVQVERVHGLVRHYSHVAVRSELLTLVHRAQPAVAELTARVRQGPALLDFTDAGGLEQTVWRAGPEESAALARLLDEHRLYIADGHHRVAAALHRWEAEGRPCGGSVLCVLYPQDQVSLHAFHRLVRGPVAVPALLDGLESAFEVRPAEGPLVQRGTLGLYAAGAWHHLVPRRRRDVPGVAGLDVTLLDEEVLRPLLGIRDGDPRVAFLPAPRPLRPVTRACDEDGGVLFTLHAPGLDDLFAVADRHEVMSAKTTYVEPKPRTGVFLL